MFTIQEIIEATKGRLMQGPARGRMRSVSIDSRTVAKSELFIAVKGEIFDGHDFITDVIARGVRVLIVHQPIKVRHADVSVIRVKDTIRALGEVARFHRLRFKTPVIALTGSAGKTTTKEMIAAVLGRKYKVLKNEGTKNNHIGVPLTLLQLRSSHQMVVLECGTNQPGDIPWLADISRPHVAVFTNIGESHLEKLKNVAGVLKEKWALTLFMGAADIAVINTDDPLLARKAHGLNCFKIITYGMKNPSSLKAGQVNIEACCLRFKVDGKMVKLNSCGMNNVYNAMAAYACGVLFEVPARDIIAALKAFEFPQGRGRIMRLGRGWLIDDTYNANPVSMRLALQTLQAVPTTSRRIMVAADMLELGTGAARLHRAAGTDIAKSGTDILITVGAFAALMAKEARNNRRMVVSACKDIESAQQCLAAVFRNGDVVLVKGSRRMKMEHIIEFLLASPGV